MSHLRTLSLPAMVQSVRYLEAQKTSGQTLSASTWTKLTYDTPSVNTAGVTIASSVFTITIPGLYLFQTGFTGQSNASVTAPKYVKNGGADPANLANHGQYSSGAGSLAQRGPACRLGKVIYLEAGDTIEIQGYDTEGVTVPVDTASRLRIVKL